VSFYKKFHQNEATKYTNENKNLERKLITIINYLLSIVICYSLAEILFEMSTGLFFLFLWNIGWGGIKNGDKIKIN
jgi:hypothetical protein